MKKYPNLTSNKIIKEPYSCEVPKSYYIINGLSALFLLFAITIFYRLNNNQNILL